VGEGRTRNELEAQVAKLNLRERVHFTGFRNDISDLLSGSDAFCLPSLSEGLPYALLEACAHRLPLLVTQVGGMAELLTHQQTAFLVPPSDPHALAKGVRWLVDHPQEASTMGQSSYELIERRFSPDEMIGQTLAVYQGAKHATNPCLPKS
jgi:glycosyltransferase involved in cell wall biosynthesis